MMPGGWLGSTGTVGGMARTYGLQGHFGREEMEGSKPKVSRAEMWRIGGYFRPYWKQCALILICVAAESGLNVMPPFCVGKILDIAIPQADGTLLALLAGAIITLAVASGLVGVAEQSLTARVGQSIMFDLRNELFRSLQRMSLQFYTSTRSGEIVSRVNNDVNAVQAVTSGTFVAIASNLFSLAATAIALFSLNWRLALIAVVVVPAFYLPSKIVGGIRRKLATQTQESQADLMVFLNERLHIGGSVLTNIFGQARADADAFRKKSARVRDLNVRQAIVGRWLRLILSVFSVVGPALVYWYGGYAVIQKELTPGLLIAFAALLTMLYRPLMQLASVYVDVQASFGVFDRIFEYLDLRPDVSDKPDAVRLPVAKGHIVFEDVGFSYPTCVGAEPEDGTPDVGKPERFALKSVSFEALPGQRVALVGPSGAGKTTITYLLPRFYDPDEGRVMLDGHDLRGMDQADLRRHIGMVTQETFLFHASIRENLLYARPDASDDAMVEACRAANIHEFISALPEGYDTLVGERGFRLSGGEKQRLSIARAILKDPRILILDEATSNLDATSEHLIQTALEELLRGRTSLIIAHRLSTILNSEQIIVMNDGRVAEMGTHTELMAQRGLYAALFTQQFGKAIEWNRGAARRVAAAAESQRESARIADGSSLRGGTVMGNPPLGGAQ